MRKVISLPIQFYQYVIRPWLKPRCRFYPSCSQYALQSIEHFGVLKGLFFAGCRLLKCHPWSQGGYDPVLPNNKEKK